MPLRLQVQALTQQLEGAREEATEVQADKQRLEAKVQKLKQVRGEVVLRADAPVVDSWLPCCLLSQCYCWYCSMLL